MGANSNLDYAVNCSARNFSTCTSYISIDMLATSCFSDTTITVNFLTVGKRLPHYVNHDSHAFDLRLMSQCAQVKNFFFFQINTYGEFLLQIVEPFTFV